MISRSHAPLAFAVMSRLTPVIAVSRLGRSEQIRQV
jgi:hypothetical protein